ncbi:E3 ubiquitin-protein ligase UBR1 [Spathaspora sp. JA1]|nr:E3 ubiquitin-protein ligase UBR1 [Spathaspora sp. JA1]
MVNSGSDLQSQLRRFLVELPARSDFSFTSATKHDLYHALYTAITNQGQHLTSLFPDISNEELDRLQSQQLRFPLSLDPPSKLFYKPSSISKQTKYSHPANKVCSKAFAENEPVYCCQDCGFDDTCVLCGNCFNPDDHKNHNIYIYKSTGDNGGICDCGDDEAFLKKLNCKCQSEEDKDMDTMQDISDLAPYILDTITVCLDYILDVTNMCVLPLPVIHDHIDQHGCSVTSESYSTNASLSPSKRYGDVLDWNSNYYYLVLWNDEYHNLQEAISSINAGTGVGDSKASEIAYKIDKEGFAVLKKDSNYKNLLGSKFLVEQGGLIATIESSRDNFRQEIVKYVFEWLEEILSFKLNSEFRELCKLIFCQVLLAPSHEVSTTVNVESFKPSEASLSDQEYFINGFQYQGRFKDAGLTHINPDFSDSLEHPISAILDPNEDPGAISHSRLQYLLIYQIRLRKCIRMKLSNLLIPCLVAEPDTKLEFSKQFIELYPMLLNMMALTDREENLNLLADISSQIFTCPNSIQFILRQDLLRNILGPLAELIEITSTRFNADTGYHSFYDIGINSQKKRAIKLAIKYAIGHLTHFSSTSLAGSEIKAFMNEETFKLWILLLKNFQSYLLMNRKYGDHVERDSDDFMLHLQYFFPLVIEVKQVIESEYENPKMVDDALVLLKCLFARPIEFSQSGVVNFQVSKDRLSFANPLHSLLSFMIEYHGINQFIPLLNNYANRLVEIADISLRSVVLGSQIKVGFWIRNGLSATHQTKIYFSSKTCDVTYYRDFHLIQIWALFSNDQNKTLLNLLSRWELLPWFLNQVSYSQTIYEERFVTICERFIVFIYNLITDRTFLTVETPNERSRRMLRIAMAYRLCREGKAYSSLKYKVDYSIPTEEFDEVLYSIADYQPPSSLVDTGLYRLKESVYEELDPLSVYLDPSKFQVITESIIKNVARIKKIKEDDVIIQPRITQANYDFVDKNIAQFVKTQMFAKLIYKLLQVAIDTSDETYLPQLLHLIHAILLDDELIHGKEYLNPHFLNIPISDLLLTIVESKMSKYVIHKADYLVDLLVMKDKRVIESLIDCFGQEYIQSYKKRKSTLFETETEKKKRLATERANKIMKKFSRQREQFLSQNKDLDSDMLANDDNGEETEHLRTCVLCGEQESVENPFGILASSTKAAVFWKIPRFKHEEVGMAFKRWNKEILFNENSASYGVGYHSGVDNKVTFELPVVSTCGHGIHYECYRRGSTGLTHYPCPLCHNLHDTFIPSYIAPLPHSRISDEFLFGDPHHSRYNMITHCTQAGPKIKDIIKGLINDDYLNTEARFDVHRKLLSTVLTRIPDRTKYGTGTTKNESYFYLLLAYSELICNTIRMNEIATRINGEEAYSNFLPQGSTKTLLISLIQGRALAFEKRGYNSLLGSQAMFQSEAEKFWDSDSILDSAFNDVVALFFQTGESLATLTRMGMVKTLAVSLYSLLNVRNESSGYEDYFLVDDFNSEQIPQDTLRDFEILIAEILVMMDLPVVIIEKKFLVSLYLAVERLMGVFLRQVVIFADLLTCRVQGENMYESIPEFANLADEIKAQDRVECTDALTTSLHVISFNKLINELSSGANDIFESRIFEVVCLSKIPKHYEKGILNLNSPGMVRLITLPHDYNASLLNASDAAAHDKSICLFCSKWVSNTGQASHMTECTNHTGIFFNPGLNTLRLAVHIGHSRIPIDLEGPYLTVHGEVKPRRSKLKATLNEFRYLYLNKLWLNQGLYAFVTRHLFGARTVDDILAADATNSPFEDDSEDMEEDYEDEIRGGIFF